MASTISIGKQDFLYLRENGYFYIDKSDFIRQWWDSADDITLITRPRRFGKTLNMSMLNYFFSNQYKDRGDIFSGLKVWQSEKYRKIQGTYPVIFISFADVKQSNYSDAIQKVKKIIADVYRQHRYLADSADLTENERRKIIDIDDKVDDVTAITNFLKEKKLKPYWALTSSNGMISKLIQRASAQIKTFMEGLVNGEEIVVSFDEQIVFNRLDSDENAIWSLLLASGYLKVEEIEYRGITLEPWYHLSITNLETISMFSSLFQGWFMDVSSNYNEFVKALFVGDLKAMNTYMNDVALSTFSSFDTGNHPSERSQPERFYHGFVLGLLVDVRDSYEVRSNKESGFGRYDVVLIPRQSGKDAIIIEFKVFDESEEESLEKTVLNAHKQIEDKNYDVDLMERGIAKENIRHYGFAFRGKKVLIG